MAQVTLNPADDVATTSGGIAAGLGPHLPVGGYGGTTYRSAMRFNAPSGFSGWTAVTAAELSFYISDHQHVAVRNSTIYCKRQTEANLWTKGAGSQNCNSGFSGGNTTQYGDITPTSTDYRAFASGTTANAKKTISVKGIVEYYQQNNTSVLVFVFEGADSNEYTELWAEGYGNNAKLVIDYETEQPPNPPLLTTSGATADDTPLLGWTHQATQGDPQTSAEVRVWNAAGTTQIGTTATVAGATSTYTPPALPRGLGYMYDVRTADVTGFGNWSTKGAFSIKALPVVTIDATRRMVFANGAPRLQVYWTADQAQTHYKIVAGAFDSGWQQGTIQNYLLSTVALTNGTPQSITVSVRSDPFPLEGSASRSFTPRWGLTTHKKDMGASPIKNWESPSITATIPTGSALQFEYGSQATDVVATAWYTVLSDVPFNRYLSWRAWFIPSATQSPVLDKVVLSANTTAALLDKWGTTRDVAALAAPWAVDTGEYVYGSRSIRVDVAGAGPYVCYAFKVKVLEGRSYILTGLMRSGGSPASGGNSGAHFRLEDAAGNPLQGGGILVPEGDVASDVLTEDRDWFEPGQHDVYRYKTPVYVADITRDVYVALRAGGTNGAKAWFDAIKLEESTVATPWSPGAIGATIVDAGGVQIDNQKGGVLRYKGSSGGLVAGGPNGLLFGNTEVYQSVAGEVIVDGKIVVANTKPIVRVYPPAASPWVKPAGLSHITVEVQGGGGQGGGQGATAAGQSSAAAGGGGGGYAKKTILASALSGTNYTVVVGAGGTGAGAGAAGGNGGLSSFAGSGITTVQGNGGAGGAAMAGSSATAGSSGGVGGTATGGDINIPGGNGGPGRLVTGSLASIAAGGGSVLSTATMPLAAAGTAGTPYGGGASGNYAGASTAASAGAAGAAGVVIVTEYYL